MPTIKTSNNHIAHLYNRNILDILTLKEHEAVKNRTIFQKICDAFGITHTEEAIRSLFIDIWGNNSLNGFHTGSELKEAIFKFRDKCTDKQLFDEHFYLVVGNNSVAIKIAKSKIATCMLSETFEYTGFIEEPNTKFDSKGLAKLKVNSQTADQITHNIKCNANPIVKILSNCFLENREQIETIKDFFNVKQSFFKTYISTLTDDTKYHNNPQSYIDEHKSALELITNANKLEIRNIGDSEFSTIVANHDNNITNLHLSGRTSSKGEMRGQILIDTFEKFQSRNNKNLYEMLLHTPPMTLEYFFNIDYVRGAISGAASRLNPETLEVLASSNLLHKLEDEATILLYQSFINGWAFASYSGTSNHKQPIVTINRTLNKTSMLVKL